MANNRGNLYALVDRMVGITLHGNDKTISRSRYEELCILYGLTQEQEKMLRALIKKHNVEISAEVLRNGYTYWTTPLDFKTVMAVESDLRAILEG